MNTSLVFICLVIAFVATEAYPGMRGNVVSGAIIDRDPSNPAFRQEAIAKAAGMNPSGYSFSQKKGAGRLSVASSSNTGGGPVSSYASA